MKKLFTILSLSFSFSLAKADYWTQKANFGGTARAGSSYFSIGNKGYIGLGTDGYPVYNFKDDFWEYDTSTNVWTQMANFPGAARYTAFSFSIGTKGYVGTGWNQVTPLFNDFWEYNQTLNSWTQKGNFPGIPRQSGIGFTINNKAYAGFGNSNSTILKDFYAYNDTTDTWTQVTVFPGSARHGLFGWGISGKGYIGTGNVSYPAVNLINDVWEYDPATNLWTQKANLPGVPRGGTRYFCINNKGYAGMGSDGTNTLIDFYEYDPVTNIWIQKAGSPLLGIEGGFTIAIYGYLGCSYHSTTGFTNQFWQYTPGSTTGIEELPTSNLEFTISPNPAKEFIVINIPGFKNLEYLSVTDAQGKKVYESKLLTSDLRLPTSHFKKGIYFLELNNGKQKAVRKFLKE